MTTYILYTTLAAAAVYAVFKFIYEMHMLQLNSYRNERYLRWLGINYGSADRGLEVIFLVIGLVLTFLLPAAGLVLLTVTFLFLSYRFYNKKHKKPPVFTDRAKRVLGVSLLLFFLLLGLYIFKTELDNTAFITAAVAAVLSVLSPVLLLLANTLLRPYEKYNHNWYINDAKRMLAAAPNLTVVGITGSYGKTSVKHFLETVLSQKYNVLMTPGSYNTPMGVVRTVREQLKPFHEIFIAEMGAKQPGDIKEICDIAHPQIGILTAVGTAHLETFKTADNIRKTKFELIDALPADGFAVLNADYEVIENQSVSQPKTYYGVQHPRADYSVEDVTVTARGSSFTVRKNGKVFGSFDTKLLGAHNLSNLAAAVAAADYLGLNEKQISTGIKKIQPVQHRLSVRRIGSDITILDDAFNSNIVGATNAVLVLGQMEGKRKIIVTPGMVELGEKTFELNREFAERIAENADIAILVGKTNEAALSSGLAAGNFPEEQIYRAADFKDATTWLGKRMQTGDVILYENDLPDSYK